MSLSDRRSAPGIAEDIKALREKQDDWTGYAFARVPQYILTRVLGALEKRTEALILITELDFHQGQTINLDNCNYRREEMLKVARAALEEK